jgi:hypothetical protein
MFSKYEQNKDLDSLVEALLIEFNYIESEKKIVIISDSINWDLEEGLREFKETTFLEVKNFHRVPGVNEKLHATKNHYHISNYQGGHVIQDITTCQVDEHFWKLTIEIDTAFGGFEFEFAGIYIHSRIGRGEETGANQWIYHDINTDEIFDFVNPF